MRRAHQERAILSPTHERGTARAIMAEHWHVVDGDSGRRDAACLAGRQKKRRQAVSRSNLRATHPDTLVWTVYTSSDVKRGLASEIDVNPSETVDLFKMVKTPPFVPADRTRNTAQHRPRIPTAEDHIGTQRRSRSLTCGQCRPTHERRTRRSRRWQCLS